MSTASTLDSQKQIDVQEQPKILRPVARLARALGIELLIGGLVLLILFLVAWYATPYYLRDYLNKRGSELPDYKLDIHWLRIHPWAASMDLENIVLVKKSGAIPVPFLTAKGVHVALQWSQILHGDFRSKIILTEPVINFVQGPTKEESQTFLEPEWVTAVKQLVPLRINQFQVVHGDVHFFDFHADPQINLRMNHIELVADNLTNSTGSKDLMPSTVTLTATPFEVGTLEAHLAANVDLKQPTFTEKVRLEKIPAPALNSFLAKYGSVYAKSGELAFYTEMVSKEGNYNGYFKPFFQDLEFEPVPKDRGGLAVIWASIANGIKDLVTNNKTDAVATNVPVNGFYKDPNIDIFAAAFGILKNAYLEALAQQFNTPELAPTGKPKDEEKVDKPVPPRP